MTHFVMQRDRVVATLAGQMFDFKKGEPVYVAPGAQREVMNAGAVPVEEGFVLAEDAPAVTVAVHGEDRKKIILSVFEKLVERNERGDFDAGSKPSVKTVSQLAGFQVDAKERNTLWVEFMEPDA